MEDTKMNKSETEKATEMETKMETEREKATEMEKEKNEKRESESVDLVTLRDDLFREAENLVSEGYYNITIVVNHPGSSSGAVFSFGSPSADGGVVKTSLKDSNSPDAVPVDADDDAEDVDDDEEDADDDEEGEDDEGEDEDDEGEEDLSSTIFWNGVPKNLKSLTAEEVRVAIDGLTQMKEMLEAKLRAAQNSGNQKDLHNDNAEPKP